jgi:hypothetical protein
LLGMVDPTGNYRRVMKAAFSRLLKF